MDILSQLKEIEGKDLTLKLGNDGRELQGKISKIHEKHNAVTAEYYDPDLGAGAGILVSFSNIESINENLVVFKK